MKTTTIIVSAILASLSLTPAQAAETKSLVIIDSYFDSRVIGGNVSCINLDGSACVDVVTKIPTSLSDNINHGDAMVEVARKQNPSLPIIALRSGIASKSSVSDVNAGNFIDALNWITKNADKVGAVSISRRFNGKSDCSPASVNTANYGGVSKADKTIRDLILSLKNRGVKIFAGAGNVMNGKVDYPACIQDLESVGVGSLNKKGLISSVYTFDANTDYFATASFSNYKSVLFNWIPNLTSTANVAVAAKYLSGTLDSKFVNVLQ